MSKRPAVSAEKGFQELHHQAFSSFETNYKEHRHGKRDEPKIGYTKFTNAPFLSRARRHGQDGVTDGTVGVYKGNTSKEAQTERLMR